MPRNDTPVAAVAHRVHVELLHHFGSQPGVTIEELPGAVHQLAARELLQCTDHLLVRGPEVLHCAQTEIAELSMLVGQHTDGFGRGNPRPQPHHENMFPLVLSCGLALVGVLRAGCKIPTWAMSRQGRWVRTSVRRTVWPDRSTTSLRTRTSFTPETNFFRADATRFFMRGALPGDSDHSEDWRDQSREHG
jgi:hypothetical protein